MEYLWRITVLILMMLILSPIRAFALEMQPYAGAGVGFFNYGKVNNAAFGLYVSGGADFPETEYFGAEIRLGTAFEADKLGGSAGAVTLESYDIDYFLAALGKAKYAVLPEVHVYGLLGLTVAGWSHELRRGGVLQIGDSGTDADISLGVGADYRLRNEWLVGIEWLRYNSDLFGLVGTIRYEY